jgi:hypothetical protein
MRVPTAASLALAALLGGAGPIAAPLAVPPAAADDVTGGPPEFTPRVQEAVERGLRYLKGTQRQDGAWDGNVGFKINESYQVTAYNVRDPGVTALAGTAFLAGGHLPGRGPYGETLNRAIEYMAGNDYRLRPSDPGWWPGVVDDKGFISENGTRMYSHAFGALFLAEVYGSSLDQGLNAQVREKLDRAVQFIVRAQNDQGGWRYEANAADSDMSVTVCQVMALRAARNKGIRVPQKCIDAAVRYVLESAVTRGSSRAWGLGDSDMRRGAFKYQWREKNPIGTRASLALTGAGMTTLFGSGLYDDQAIAAWARDHGMARFGPGGEAPPTIREMAQYILDEYEDHARSYPRHYFFFYGHYYACQAMYIAGGRWWEQYFPLVRDHLLRHQDTDGSWDVQGVGRNFGTAVACVILQVPCRYLPVLDQR